MHAQDFQILESYINKKREKCDDDGDNNVIITPRSKNVYTPIPTCNTCKQMAFVVYEKKKKKENAIRMKMWVILWCNQVFIALATALFFLF